MSDGRFPQRPFFPRPPDPRDRDQPVPGERASDPSRSDRHGPATDPLIELARLIGQSDPFAPVPPHPIARDPHDQVPPIRPPARDFPPAQDRYAADFGRQDYAHKDYDRREAPPAPQFPLRPAHPEPALASPLAALAYARRDEYPVAPQLAPSADHGNGRGEYYADPAGRDDPAYAQEGQQLGQQLGQQSGQQPDEYAADDAEAGAYQDDEEYEYGTEPGEGDHEDAGPAVKRRNNAKIAIAVLGLAVFGSAAAFGYRTIFKGSVPGPAPVIRADTSPTKVIPAGDGAAKSINERLSDGSTERVVRRDEDPVELRDPSRGGNAGAVVPGSGGPLVGAFPSSGASPSASPTSLAEPKRVRTVTIRADQGVSSPDRTALPSVPPRAAPPTQRQVAAVPVAPAAPPPPVSQVPQAPPGSAGAPLSIAPSGMAATDPAPPARAPARAAEAGGFVVQLSAQKSEAEAQASYRAMQAKYAVLNGYQPLIRRKDQGERGVFYAAQVGPFGSKDEASQLCDSLKSAGGSCFVLRN